MSLQIPIQKDIGEYQEKIVGKMSLRTLVCVTGGFACAIAVACFIYFVFHIEVGSATLPVMAAALPFWLAGFWRPFGMKLEEFMPLFIDQHFKPQRLLYSTADSFEATGPVPGKPSRKSRKQFKRKGAEFREPAKQAVQQAQQ